MSKINPYLIVFLTFPMLVAGCTANQTDDDTDSDSLPRHRDTASVLQDTDTASSSEENVGPDTADGLGGIDEECYTFDQNDTILMWCDTPEMVMQQCDAFASGCCCRAPCDPTMCDGAEETLPCTMYDAVNLLGYCDYAIDNVPVAYECLENCTPRSACVTVDTDGACLDTDAQRDGVCLIGGEDTDAEAFCQPSCAIARCDDSHYCSPLFAGEYYDGAGACLPM